MNDNTQIPRHKLNNSTSSSSSQRRDKQSNFSDLPSSLSTVDHNNSSFLDVQNQSQLPLGGGLEGRTVSNREVSIEVTDSNQR